LKVKFRREFRKKYFRFAKPQISAFKALPRTTEITTPGRLKHFITIGLPIAAMAMSSFNAYRIMQLDYEIKALKSKTDLLVDVSCLHNAHLDYLEEKTDAINKVLGMC
jgi:hypothetical protein